MLTKKRWVEGGREGGRQGGRVCTVHALPRTLRIYLLQAVNAIYRIVVHYLTCIYLIFQFSIQFNSISF